MTDYALAAVPPVLGLAQSADVDYVHQRSGRTLAAETTTSASPVLAVIFGQAV